MTLLSVRNLSLSIGDTDILHDVDVDVAPGQITAITGESGSGKSLTALSVMDLLPRGSQVQGQILFGGDDLLAMDEAQMCALRGNDIAMIFQEPLTALNPVKSVGDQVAETILIHTDESRRQAKARARDVMNRVGLDGISLDRFPHELSGGQRQRVCIAMAIALRPKLLIADEPTTALDVTTQATILDLLKGLVREFDMGLLMITHDLAVVADFADSIAVMQMGRVVEAGPTGDVLQNQTHPYTRALLAASTHQVDLPDAPSPDPLLVVDGVTRTYRRPRVGLAAPGVVRAVDDVSFTLARGERLGLVGESGCGKSTLTRAILGLDTVQAGDITLGGKSVFADGLAVRRRMQVVFQDPYGSFNPRHRVDRLITEPFHVLDRPPKGAARAQVIARALTDVGLDPEDAGKFIHEFSGGQRQRLAIARALIVEPDLIVFDEAVSALDVSVRAQVLDLIADLCRKRPLSYLFISHDLSVVRTVTDRVLVMRAGQIVEQGPTEDVFQNPTHPYTQELLAAAPVLPDYATAGGPT